MFHISQEVTPLSILAMLYICNKVLEDCDELTAKYVAM